MVAEAEKYKAEDDAQKEKVEARNQLENFCYQVKNMASEQLGDKMSADDKAAIEKASKDGLSGLTHTRTRRRLRPRRRRRRSRLSSSRLLRRRTSRLEQLVGCRAACPVGCPVASLAVRAGSRVLLRAAGLLRRRAVDQGG